MVSVPLRITSKHITTHIIGLQWRNVFKPHLTSRTTKAPVPEIPTNSSSTPAPSFTRPCLRKGEGGYCACAGGLPKVLCCRTICAPPLLSPSPHQVLPAPAYYLPEPFAAALGPLVPGASSGGCGKPPLILPVPTPNCRDLLGLPRLVGAPGPPTGPYAPSGVIGCPVGAPTDAHTP